MTAYRGDGVLLWMRGSREDGTNAASGAVLAVTAQKRAWTRVLEIRGAAACQMRPTPVELAAETSVAALTYKEAELASGM